VTSNLIPFSSRWTCSRARTRAWVAVRSLALVILMRPFLCMGGCVAMSPSPRPGRREGVSHGDPTAVTVDAAPLYCLSRGGGGHRK
jgi:hypothetical protein